MQPLDTITTEYKGHTITVNVYHDEHMGEPWKEHDGRGIVSDWERRDKHPGELVLCSDHGSSLFYDYSGTMTLARKDGWGLGKKELAKLTAKLGRKPTKGEIVHASVMSDYEHLRGWCNDEWSWTGYQTKVEDADGNELPIEDSCWGFDGQDYMVGEAKSNAEYLIDRHIEATAKELAESELMACRDIATIA